jgi:hypothetical protein
MKHFTDWTHNETDAEVEREMLMADIVHLREQCKRYQRADGTNSVGGVAGIMMREKSRLFAMLHDM